MYSRLTLTITLVLVTLGSGGTAAAPIADDAFFNTWSRTDQPVADNTVDRTWMWGPEAYSGPLIESYEDAPGDKRTVQYFDKSRMEITDPGADQDSLWFVTNGLLATELMTGEMQLGDDEFTEYEPADVQIAGDPDPSAPTYAMFGELMDAEPQTEGETITATFDADGQTGANSEMSDHAVTAEHHVDDTGHTVASVFWEFMNSTGTVNDGTGYVDDQPLFENPFFAVGLPITGAYWVEVPVAGVDRDVLAQCFERRCLTYTPENDPGWRVEAGNIGQHYHDWRYHQLGLEPIAPLASATIGPDGGSLEADGGTFTMNVPSGAVDEDTEFTAQRVTSIGAEDETPLETASFLDVSPPITAFETGPIVTTFGEQVKITVQIGNQQIPAGSELTDIDMFRWSDDGWNALTDVSHDESDNSVSGFLDELGLVWLSEDESSLPPLAPLPPDDDDLPLVPLPGDDWYVQDSIRATTPEAFVRDDVSFVVYRCSGPGFTDMMEVSHTFTWHAPTDQQTQVSKQIELDFDLFVGEAEGEYSIEAEGAYTLNGEPQTHAISVTYSYRIAEWEHDVFVFIDYERVSYSHQAESIQGIDMSWEHPDPGDDGLTFPAASGQYEKQVLECE